MEYFFRWLLDMIGLLKCAVIVNAYEKGVLLRFGKFRKVLEPGFHLMLPLGIDMALTHEVVLTTRTTSEQSLTTLDGCKVVLSSIVGYTLTDIRKILLEVENAETVLANFAYGLLAELVSKNTSSYVFSGNFREDYERCLIVEAEKLGMTIERALIVDLCEIHTVRLMMPGQS